MIDAIDWQHVLALDVSCTVDGVTGKFVNWLAIEMARQNHCRAYDGQKNVLVDYRSDKK